MSLRVVDLSIHPNGTGLILLRKSETDQTGKSVLLALDRQTTQMTKAWLQLGGIFDSYPVRVIVGGCINKSMDPGQVSRTFKSLALKAKFCLETYP